MTCGGGRLPRHVPAQTCAQHIERNANRARVRLCDDPKRHNERKGRAERDDDRLELGRVDEPRFDEVGKRLAGAADGASRVVRVVE